MKERLLNLVEQADHAVEAGETTKALSVFLRVLRQKPNLLLPRIKIGQILARRGDAAASHNVFEALGSYFQKRGLPLLAVVAMKALQKDAPERYAALADSYATIYGADSERISKRTKLQFWDENPLTDIPEIPLASNDRRVIKISAKIASLMPGARKFPNQLPAAPFLSSFEAPILRQILDDIDVLFFKNDEMLIAEGKSGNVLTIGALGRVRVLKNAGTPNEAQLAILRRGAVMGEISFLTGAPRSASIVSVGPSIALQVPRSTLQRIQKQQPRIFQLLRVQAVRRILVNVLRTSILFRDLNDAKKTVLLKTFQSRHFKRGQAIIAEGQIGEGLYMLLTGRAKVYAGVGAAAKELAKLKEGDIFGEISLIMDQPTSATVEATTEVHTLFLRRKDFDAVMVEFPTVKEKIEQISRDRLIDNDTILGDYSEAEVEEVELEGWDETEINSILDLESDDEDDSSPSTPPQIVAQAPKPGAALTSESSESLAIDVAPNTSAKRDESAS